MIPLLGRNSPIILSTQIKQAQGLVTPSTIPAIQTAQWCRNGKQPNALFESLKSQSANFASVFRTKEVFRASGQLQNLESPGPGLTPRYYFAFHSGPYAHALYVLPAMAGYAQSSTQSSGMQFDLTTGGVTSSTTFTYGTTPYGPVSYGPSFESIRTVPQAIAIEPDTDYTVTISSVDNGIIVGLVVAELASLTENNQGYAPENFAQGSNIYAENRASLASMSSQLWKRGGAQVMNAYRDNGVGATAWTISTATPTNIIDGTTTSVTSQSPGWMFDLTGKARLSQNGRVSVRMAAYGEVTSGAAIASVYLLDQNGNVLLELDGFESFTSLTWISDITTLPATLGRYYIFARCDGSHLFDLRAISIYEYED